MWDLPGSERIFKFIGRNYDSSFLIKFVYISFKMED